MVLRRTKNLRSTFIETQMRNTKIKELIKRLEEGYGNQEKQLEQIVKLNSKQILDLNKQQLFEGVDSSNKSLGKYKSKWYAAFKKMLNPNGVVDLYLEGGFYTGFFIKRLKFPIQIDSRDYKRNKLVEQYGKNIFGLNQESKRIFARDIIKVALNNYWKKILRVRGY